MTNITEDYVSFETAKLLKENGFDWDCKQVYDLVRPQSCADGKMYDNFPDKNPNAYDELVSAPTLQMAMKWLREEKDVQIEIPIVGTETWESPTKWMYGFRCQTKEVIDRRNADFSSYEEACEAAIKYCLENLI